MSVCVLDHSLICSFAHQWQIKQWSKCQPEEFVFLSFTWNMSFWSKMGKLDSNDNVEEIWSKKTALFFNAWDDSDHGGMIMVIMWGNLKAGSVQHACLVLIDDPEESYWLLSLIYFFLLSLSITLSLCTFFSAFLLSNTCIQCIHEG